MYVIAADKKDPVDNYDNDFDGKLDEDDNARIWFEGPVDLLTTFDDNSLNGIKEGQPDPKDHLSGDTYIFVYDGDPLAGGVLLQQVKFKTSCGEPLRIGDQFGTWLLTGYVPEP